MHHRLKPCPMLARVSGRQLFRKPPKAVADGLLSGLPKCKADPVSSVGQDVSVAVEESQPMVPTQIVPSGPRGRAGPRGTAMAGRGAAVTADAASTASSRAHGQDGEGGADERGASASWELRDDMAEKLAELFRSVDTNEDNVLDDDEKVAKKHMIERLMMEYGLSPTALSKLGAGRVSFEQFCDTFRREWETSSKVQALPGEELLHCIALGLPGGSPELPLGALEGMSREKLQEACGRVMLPAIEEVLLKQQAELIEQKRRMESSTVATDDAENGKFVVANFGCLADFHGGIAAQLGLPNPNLMEGLKAEHCSRGDSTLEFKPGNYDTTTTPEAEWLVVTNEDKAKEASVPPRRVRTVKDIMEKEAIVKEAGLREEEVMALLLYTGPMFAKYNASLRRFPADRVEALCGNKYTTTIYCVVSGIIKLSRKMKLPADRKAYRGLGGLDLPEAFLKMDEHGVRGGVEFGMLSTTLDRNVAVQYAGKSIPTVFEIGLGAIDRGASVSFLSQYPGEEEILLPPRSYLEVVGGVSRQEAGPDGHLIRVISLKVNANASSSTIEQIESRRKEIFLSAAGDCLLDIRSKLEHRMNGDDVRKVLHHRQWDLKNKTHEKIRDSILEEADAWLEGYRKRPSEWFNDEYCYARAVKELGGLEKIAVGKFQYWLGENGEGDRLVGERMQIIERLTESEMRCKVDALLRDAEQCKVDSEERKSLKDGARELALGLCKRRGLVTKSEDEVDDLGESPIIASGVVGNVVDLKLLIAAGASVDSISGNGSTSLHMACLMGHNDYIRDLVEAKADISCVDGAGRTGLHLATEIGHHDTVALMLELGGRDLGMKLTNDGVSCAFLACHREDGVDELKRIVDVCGVEILDVQDKEGRSCARKAAGRGNLRVLQYLSETAGRKNLELRMHGGSTIAMVAAMNNHLEVLKYISRELGKDFLMLEGTCGWTCLMVAAEYGHLDIVRYLFELCGSDMLMKVSCASAAGDQAVSCAWVASKFGHLEVVEYMAQVGGRPLLELEARDGRSCMRVAEQAGHARVCEFIASFLGIGMPGESATASS